MGDHDPARRVADFLAEARFSENLPADITFELDLRGDAAPDVRAGDGARVIINGKPTLLGTFRQD